MPDEAEAKAIADRVLGKADREAEAYVIADRVLGKSDPEVAAQVDAILRGD